MGAVLTRHVSCTHGRIKAGLNVRGGAADGAAIGWCRQPGPRRRSTRLAPSAGTRPGRREASITVDFPRPRLPAPPTGPTPRLVTRREKRPSLPGAVAPLINSGVVIATRGARDAAARRARRRAKGSLAVSVKSTSRRLLSSRSPNEQRDTAAAEPRNDVALRAPGIDRRQSSLF
ncbi:unnamed protein product [Lampetra planeri]